MQCIVTWSHPVSQQNSRSCLTVCTLKVDCQLNWKPHPNTFPFLPQHSGVASGGNGRSATPCLATEAEEALVNLLEEKGQGRRSVGGLEIGKIQKWRGLKLKTFASPTPGWMNHPIGGGKTIACKEEGKLSSPNLRKQTLTLTCRLMLTV